MEKQPRRWAVKAVRLGAAAAIGALLLSIASPVTAHEEHALHALTVLGRVAPDVQGLDVRVVHLDAPALAIANETGRVLEVTAESGEPFLRIGPRGVFANSQSPTTYKSIDPSHDVVPTDVDPAAPPRWVRFTDESSWSWFDPRLVYAPGHSTWTVPMALGDVTLDVRGGFEPLAGHGHFINQLEVAEIEGLDIRLVQGAVPAVYVRNESQRVLRVAGAADEPFLRIGRKGVWANIRSPSYYSGGSLSIRKVPRFADASAPPKWKKVSEQPVWGWLEYRAALEPGQLERDALGDTRRVVHSWSPRLVLGGESIAATGEVVWVPPRVTAHSSRSWPWVPIATGVLALAALAGAAIVLRRYRRVEPA